MTDDRQNGDPNVSDGVQLKAIKPAEGGEGVLPVARKRDRLLVDTDLNNRHICR